MKGLPCITTSESKPRLIKKGDKLQSLRFTIPCAAARRSPMTVILFRMIIAYPNPNRWRFNGRDPVIWALRGFFVLGNVV